MIKHIIDFCKVSFERKQRQEVVEKELSKIDLSEWSKDEIIEVLNPRIRELELRLDALETFLKEDRFEIHKEFKNIAADVNKLETDANKRIDKISIRVSTLDGKPLNFDPIVLVKK